MTFGKLNSYSLIKISGADAATFLQGQLTNDVSALNTQWQFTGYCNPKGRLLALLQLWKTSTDEFYALLSKDLAESVVKRLQMYVMRSKVEIQITNRTISAYNSLQDLKTHNQIDIEKNSQSMPFDMLALDNNNYLLNISNRYLLISDQKDTSNSFDSHWLASNIRQGLPNIINSTAELFIPQMVNLDLLNGISFKKGCYTGQEIVARMHYLGKLKQRMFVCRLEKISDTLKAGDKILNDIKDQKTVGNIVDCVKHNDTVLAVLKLEYINDHLYLADGIKMSIIDPQPYPIPNLTSK